MPEGTPYGARLTALAQRNGDANALVFAAVDGTDVRVSWRELDERANQVARFLAGRGLGQDRTIVIAFKNSLEHVYTTFGAWKVGASILPLRADLPAWERDRLLDIAAADLIAADWDDVAGVVTSADVRATTGLDSTPLEHVGTPKTSKLIATSGSTGTPKIIVGTAPGVFDENQAVPSSMTGGGGARMLVVSPLYHNNGSMFCYPVLLQDNPVVLMEHFEAGRAVGLIERHRVSSTVMVPTMLQRIARLENVGERDLSSLDRVVYGGASLPEWVARVWLDLVSPEKFLFVYGGSEGMGGTSCTGKEWLDHPGTCGTPNNCEIRILDADRNEVPLGEVGEIFMRLETTAQPFEYVGVATPEPILGGFRSYGDMGYVDGDGYLYVVDRRQDMIISGGANIFPAEIEAALSEHPAVVDAVVIGLPDPEWGQRVHAIVQLDAVDAPTEADLRDHCRERLAAYKVPKAVEVIEAMPRTTAGKINRSRLVTERAPA